MLYAVRLLLCPKANSVMHSRVRGVRTFGAEGIQDDEDKTEYLDTEEEVNSKCLLLAKWIKESKYMVAYTGAGISTSAGIPDFRGPQGMWQRLSEGKPVVVCF